MADRCSGRSAYADSNYFGARAGKCKAICLHPAHQQLINAYCPKLMTFALLEMNLQEYNIYNITQLYSKIREFKCCMLWCTTHFIVQK